MLVFGYRKIGGWVSLSLWWKERRSDEGEVVSGSGSVLKGRRDPCCEVVTTPSFWEFRRKKIFVSLLLFFEIHILSFTYRHLTPGETNEGSPLSLVYSDILFYMFCFCVCSCLRFAVA